MPRCCGGASCSCVIQGDESHIHVAGTGSPEDPFVILGDIDVTVADTPVINMTLTGNGTTTTPWVISATFAASASLNDLPDVTSAAATNGQVLGWDQSLGQWTPRAPTTAAAGTVTHDTSLAGDGSAGAALQVNEDPARMLGTTGAGLGLSDTGMNAVVRKFADATARGSAAPAPVLNALSMVATVPGQIDYWTGSAWSPAGAIGLDMTGQEFFPLSGPYTGAQRVTLMVRQVDQITDANGQFDAIPAADLAAKAGVLTATVQPVAADPDSIATPFTVILAPDTSTTAIKGVAYRLDDGQVLPLSSVQCTVLALTY
jgi:hypothetical protein